VPGLALNQSRSFQYFRIARPDIILVEVEVDHLERRSLYLGGGGGGGGGAGGGGGGGGGAAVAAAVALLVPAVAPAFHPSGLHETTASARENATNTTNSNEPSALLFITQSLL